MGEMGLGREMGWGGRWVWGWEMGLGKGDGFGEGDGIGAGLFTGWVPFTECSQTDTHRHTEVKTVYPPVSLHSLGGYKNWPAKK